MWQSSAHYARFTTLEPKDGKSEFPVIFKVGDDIRQDQLVLQLIELMDDLLKKENLDMKLTIYRALPTSSKVCDCLVLLMIRKGCWRWFPIRSMCQMYVLIVCSKLIIR